jgi:hypothetical protein
MPQHVRSFVSGVLIPFSVNVTKKRNGDPRWRSPSCVDLVIPPVVVVPAPPVPPVVVVAVVVVAAVISVVIVAMVVRVT